MRKASQLSIFEDTKANVPYFISPIMTESPQAPGKIFLKASLFDHISKPAVEVFTKRREPWGNLIEGAHQQ